MTIEELIQWWIEQTCYSPEEQHEFIERLRKKYDGYMGMLPEEMPDDHKKLFISSREQEFIDSDHKHDTEIIYLINSWCEFHQRKRTQPPRDMGIHIENLGWLKYLSSLSKEEVINEALGAGAQSALKSYQQSRTASNPRADNLKKVITEILEKDNNLSWKGVLSKLKNLADSNHEVCDILLWVQNQIQVIIPDL